MSAQGNIGAFLVVIFACMSNEPAAGEPSRDHAVEAIQLEQQTDCLNAESVRTSLSDVLHDADANRLTASVVDAHAVTGTVVTLRVMIRETGEIVLERSFTFHEADCINAHHALKVVLEQFLSGFPVAKWKSTPKSAPPPPKEVHIKEVRIKEVVVERDSLRAVWQLSTGASVRLPQPGAAVELGFGPDVGTVSNGFIGNVAARLTYPRSLEKGRYLETEVLLGLGWRGAFRKRLEIRLYARSGGLYLRGIGFDKNFSRWLPMLAFQGIVAWRFGLSSIGFDFGGSPLQHSVSTAKGNKQSLSFLHLGLHWSLQMADFGPGDTKE